MCRRLGGEKVFAKSRLGGGILANTIAHHPTPRHVACGQEKYRSPRPSRATEAGFVSNRTFAAMPNRRLVLLDKTPRLWHNAPVGLLCTWSVQ